ncbi:hypothetical protein ACSNOD_31120, partial [Streptomyces sp. URMC 123]
MRRPRSPIPSGLLRRARRVPLSGGARLLGALLLLTTAGAATGTAAALPSDGGGGGDTARTAPLGRVVPAPAVVRPGGAPYEIGRSTRIQVTAGSSEARRIGDYLAGVLRPSTGHPLPVTSHQGGHDGIRLLLDGRGGGADTAPP